MYHVKELKIGKNARLLKIGANAKNDHQPSQNSFKLTSSTIRKLITTFFAIRKFKRVLKLKFWDRILIDDIQCQIEQ